MKIKEYDEVMKIWQNRQKCRVYCKCGHSILIPTKRGKLICGWCGSTVYRDKKLEFKERLKGLGINVREDI